MAGLLEIAEGFPHRTLAEGEVLLTDGHASTCATCW